MSIPKPNFTMVPNFILDDCMADMSDSELRVVMVVCRKTFGWQKEQDKISLSQLMKATGLSRQGVLNGISKAEADNFIAREKSGQTYIYRLLVDGQPSGLAIDVTSQPSRPEVVNDVDQLSGKVVNVVDTQNKVTEIKETKLPAAINPPPIIERKSQGELRTMVENAMFGISAGDPLIDYPEDVREIIRRFTDLWRIAPPYKKNDKKGFGYWIKSARELSGIIREFGLEILDEYYQEYSSMARPYGMNSPQSIITGVRTLIGKKQAAGSGVSNIPGIWIGVENG